MKRTTLYKIMNFLIGNLTRTTYIGTEDIPSEGGIIVATNHLSRIDAPLLLLTPGRTDISALATTKYQRYPFFKWILDSAGTVWIDRERADFSAIRAGTDFLNKGGALGIAPEGTRSQVGALLEGKPGIVLLADKAKVPIVPVGISGSEVMMRQLRRLRRTDITMHFGKPFTLPPLDRNDRAGWLQSCTDEIMCRIAVLLPPAYHGFYAGHPRLKELQETGG